MIRYVEMYVPEIKNPYGWYIILFCMTSSPTPDNLAIVYFFKYYYYYSIIIPIILYIVCN